MVAVPDDIVPTQYHFSGHDADADAKELLYILPRQIRQERVGMALVNTLVMADLTLCQFFEIIRQNWYHWMGRKVTFSKDTSQELQNLVLEGDGLVQLRDGKFFCIGCGGVALEIPDFITATNLHALLDPCCPALLGCKDSSHVTKSQVVLVPPNVNHLSTCEEVEKMASSTFRLWNRRMMETEDRRATLSVVDQKEVGNATRIADAGWYA